MNTVSRELLFDVLHEGVYLVDSEKRITYWNQGAERISGYRSCQVVGRHCSDNLLRHINAEGRELCLSGCPVSTAMSSRKQCEAKVYLHHADGHRVPVVVRVIPLTSSEGKVIGAAEVFIEQNNREDLLKEMEELRKEVLIDPLTQIGNRLFAESVMKEQIASYNAGGLAWGLLLIDIDDFKRVNDTYGHLAGDATLRMVAKSVASALRLLDAVARWGGEEFVTVLPNCDMNSMQKIAERIRSMVEQSWIDYDGVRIAVTISVGAALAKPSEPMIETIRRADEAMYESKRSGKNKVSLAQ